MDIREQFIEIAKQNHCRYCHNIGEMGVLSEKCNGDAEYTADASLSLFVHLIEEEAKGLRDTENMIEVCKNYSDDLDTSIHFDDGYSRALSDLSHCLIEAVKGNHE